SLQRHCRRLGDARGAALCRPELQRRRLALVGARCDPRRVSVLRDGRDHRLRRLLERRNRRRSRDLGSHPAARPRHRRVHRRCDGIGRLPPHRARHRHHESVRRRDQSALLASAVLLRRAPFPARLTTGPIPMNAVPAPLLKVDEVSKAFPKPDGEGKLVVLEGVNLQVSEGEIVGILGRSGSGKSTLLRLIAGLSEPSGGELTYLGQPISGPARGIAMVFQSFAIFPWLTVYENVALGLEALRIPRAEIRRRSLAAIDLIGLDGFESAYPRELSGGMRQRVGFARALVVHPNILLMDEA